MQEYCLSPKSDEETKIHNSHAQYGRKLGYIYTGDFNSIIELNNNIYSSVTITKFETH